MMRSLLAALLVLATFTVAQADNGGAWNGNNGVWDEHSGAWDGQHLEDQSPQTQDRFRQVYGPSGAELGWITEHNRAHFYAVEETTPVPSRPTPLPTASNGMHVTVRDGGECSIPIEDELNNIIGWTAASLDGATGTIVTQFYHTVIVQPDPDQSVSSACLDSSGHWRLNMNQLVECLAVADAFGSIRSACGPNPPDYPLGHINYCWPRVCDTPEDAERLVAGERACEEGKINPCYLNDFQPGEGN